MFKVHKLYAHNPLRNYTYIISNDKEAYVIDPYHSEDVVSYLTSFKLQLKAIINTHEHWDHTQGNQKLLFKTKTKEVWCHEDAKGIIPNASRVLKANEIIELSEDSKLKVLDTPGHTYAHLCFQYYYKDEVVGIFTGDTLFQAGVGNCRNGGDPETLYNTIKTYFSPEALDDKVIVYPGHDYLKNNLTFTLHIEPENVLAKEMLRHTPEFTLTDMGTERKINTFLRLDSEEIKENLKKMNKACATEQDVFVSLRSLRDNW
jgi:hydroxyacylglutathione hydrolase